MNDRFRFRLWDAELQTYFFSNDDGSLQFDIEKVLDGLNITDGDVLEQCTGLKDKNGRLIYEGDIVSLPWQAGWKPLIGVVKFNEKLASFLLAGNEATEAERSFWWNEGKEVIGNIHENPELLEDK